MENQIVFYGDSKTQCFIKSLVWFNSTLNGMPNFTEIKYKYIDSGVCAIVTFPITKEQLAWKIINE